ncbi:hypothetical protein [Lactococcus kimchii]|uniref:hypothetical protein n=1 Tax=Lactococcus sp. S-13 TaxID=2507158 RepID=UPI001023166A|nr:hypothetical protein [Lactococcus sp. S-13]RZI48416.1 hypothetical protein EQJ87_02530 [Lactococcus sp. S-13]
MTDLKKITAGMDNGCAAIDENFTKVNNDLIKLQTGDIPWTGVALSSGWGADSGVLTQYRVIGDHIEIKAYGLKPTKDIPAGSFYEVLTLSGHPELASGSDFSLTFFDTNNLNPLQGRARISGGKLSVIPPLALTAGSRYVIGFFITDKA